MSTSPWSNCRVNGRSLDGMGFIPSQAGYLNPLLLSRLYAEVARTILRPRIVFSRLSDCLPRPVFEAGELSTPMVRLLGAPILPAPFSMLYLVRISSSRLVVSSSFTTLIASTSSRVVASRSWNFICIDLLFHLQSINRPAPQVGP